MTANVQVRRGILRGPGQLTLHPAHSPNLDERSEPMPERTCSIDGCVRTDVVGRGWCKKHYRTWQRHGDPGWRRPTVEDRFWSRVDKTETCWLWMASVDEKGYGRFRRDSSKTSRAHIVSYEMVHGPVPEGLYVCHHCDTPPCVRPDHLYAGTPLQNAQDATRRNRRTVLRGTDLPHTRYSDEVIAEVRRRYESGIPATKAGAEFGMSRSYSYRVAKGQERA